MNIQQVDILQAIDVDIQISPDGKRLWVNVDGICALRVGRIDRLTLIDNRQDGSEITGGSRDTSTE